MVEVNLHPSVYQWIDEMARITKPDKIVWIDGSEEEKEKLIKEALQTGELMELNQEKLPGCYLTEHIRAMLQGLKTGHLSALQQKKRQVKQTTGWTQMRLTRCSTHFLTVP